MNKLKVFADFHNADQLGRLRLNCDGTKEDLARNKIQLKEGMPLVLYSEELEADGIAHYSEDEGIWVAEINWDHIRGA